MPKRKAIHGSRTPGPMSSACWNAAAPVSPGPSSSCGSRSKAEGAPKNLWGEKKPGDTTIIQVLLVPLGTSSLTQMTLGPGHQAVLLEHLCSSTCPCTGISNATFCFRAGHGPPPYKGCCVPLAARSAPVASSPGSPALGREVVAAHCTQECCPAPPWAGPTNFSGGSQVWHLLKEPPM